MVGVEGEMSTFDELSWLFFGWLGVAVGVMMGMVWSFHLRWGSPHGSDRGAASVLRYSR